MKSLFPVLLTLPLLLAACGDSGTLRVDGLVARSAAMTAASASALALLLGGGDLVVERVRIALSEIEFEGGLPVRCDDKTDLAQIVHYLNDVGGENAIGKIDMFEDGMIGLKSREVYEAPAARIILTLHQDLEQLCLTKEQVQFKPLVERQWAYMVYHGGWYHPVRVDCDAFIAASQWAVNGRYKLVFFKGNIDIVERESDSRLFRPELRAIVEREKETGEVRIVWDQQESGPAVKIHGFQYQILGHRGMPYVE